MFLQRFHTGGCVGRGHSANSGQQRNVQARLPQRGTAIGVFVVGVLGFVGKCEQVLDSAVRVLLRLLRTLIIYINHNIWLNFG